METLSNKKIPETKDALVKELSSAVAGWESSSSTLWEMLYHDVNFGEIDRIDLFTPVGNLNRGVIIDRKRDPSSENIHDYVYTVDVINPSNRFSLGLTICGGGFVDDNLCTRVEMARPSPASTREGKISLWKYDSTSPVADSNFWNLGTALINYFSNEVRQALDQKQIPAAPLG